MSAHARLSASKMKQAKACRGSVLAQIGYPNRESKAAKEGTAAHWLAEEILRGVAAGSPVNKQQYVGKKAPNGVTIRQEMLTAVDVYVGEVLSRASRDGGASFVGIEVKLDHLAKLHPDLGGTSDAVIYTASTQTLYVMDYKNGAGVVVDPDENEQAMTYGMGALMHPYIRGRPVESVEIVIVQPNAVGEPVKVWRTDPVRLLEWAAEAVEIAEEARNPNAPRCAGPQCQFCLASGDCQTHYEFALDAAGITPVDFYSDVIPKVQEARLLSPDELAKRLNQAEHLERWIKSIRQHALERALEGSPPAGFKLVAGRSERIFSDPDRAIAAVARQFGLDISELVNSRPMSPNQVEGVVGKKDAQKWDKWETLIIKKPGNPTLAPLSDKRSEISKSDGFDDVSGFDID